MEDLLAQLPIVGGVLAALFAGPALAFGVLVARKRRAREARRSPIGIDLLRAPGHSLRDQIDEVSSDLLWDISMLMTFPLLTLSLFLAQAHLRGGLTGMLHLAPVYAAFAIAFVLWVLWKLTRKGVRLDNLRAGYDAEVAVGQELDQLMRQGAAVFHDFPADNFNVDHIVISRRGIFAVETKGYTKRGDLRGKAGARVVFDGSSLAFPHWRTQEPLEQAERQAQWLSRWMSKATGDSINVVPVLALPGWFVDRKGRGAVRVYSGRELAQLLDAQGAEPISQEAMQRAAHQVEQRCRDVAPKLRDP